MTEQSDKLRQAVEMLLDALDYSTPANCDCGGEDYCACCDAYEILRETEK